MFLTKMPKLLQIRLTVFALYICCLPAFTFTQFASGHQVSSSSWQFAVAAKTKIIFYDETWQQLTAAAHQFDQLTALTFDETEEILYFSDQLHNDGSIFSLKLPMSADGMEFTEKVVQRTQNESIRGIAYDPLQRHIYWTDAKQRKIFYARIAVGDEQTVEPKVFVDFTNETSVPDGLALDICQRKLYWTNSYLNNATVERINLNGTQREVIVKTDLYQPHGIVVDQLSDRIYWVVHQQGVHFSVESAELDGKGRHVVVRGINHDPANLAVTRDSIFWTDLTHEAVWSHPKFGNQSETDEDMLQERMQKKVSFREPTYGIVARSHIFQTLANDLHCGKVVKELKQRLLTPKVTRSPIDDQLYKMQRSYCLNNGRFVEDSGLCVCPAGYTGLRCENNDCHNYCVHGTCSISNMGFPECNCQAGFTGKRCQSSKCTGYCFNDGLCNIDESGKPNCDCSNNFGGQRCEKNSTEICGLFCRVLKHEPDAYVPLGCHDICESLALHAAEGAETYAIPKFPYLEVCRGEKCQLSKCAGHCLNEGVCKIGQSGEPTCKCSENFGGQRCEKNSTEICGLFCRILKHEPKTYVPLGCHDICENLALHTEEGTETYAIPKYEHLETCHSTTVWTSYAVVTVVVGVVATLSLFAIILHGLRRIFKPKRPRIKKTFVVRKQARTNSTSDTPLTNRPLATEQCEITIENCCNMNICETPCFDPKLVEQTLTRDPKIRIKEDKKILIHNMEDELY